MLYYFISLTYCALARLCDREDFSPAGLLPLRASGGRVGRYEADTLSFPVRSFWRNLLLFPPGHNSPPPPLPPQLSTGPMPYSTVVAKATGNRKRGYTMKIIFEYVISLRVQTGLTVSSVSIRDLLRVDTHSSFPNRDASNALFRKQHFQKCADQEETAGLVDAGFMMQTGIQEQNDCLEPVRPEGQETFTPAPQGSWLSALGTWALSQKASEDWYPLIPEPTPNHRCLKLPLIREEQTQACRARCFSIPHRAVAAAKINTNVTIGCLNATKGALRDRESPPGARGAAPPQPRAHASALAPSPEIIFRGFFSFFLHPPPPVTFSPNRIVKCKSSFAAGNPGSPPSDSGSLSGVRCPSAANPGDGVGSPPTHTPTQPSAVGPAVPPSEAEERVRPTPVSGRGTGALRARRVAGLAAGSSARPGLEPAARRASSLLLSPLSGVHCAPLLLGPPSPSPPSRDEPAAWGANPGALHPGPSPRRGLPKSNVEAPPGKEVRLPLRAALVRSGIGRKWLEHPSRAFAVSPRFAEGKQLPPKSYRPLPHERPAQFQNDANAASCGVSIRSVLMRS
ncbi:uncharacterized protein LOC125911395 [Panthera uncia]|uniref:uncharacterized protein LOC125911395 n=1 Tax=Panthera uncia TaxID=29064 RepID=UPI0020FFBB90|nr:uncharacterized protein LOC125911395 [Panthera uncia]